MKDKTHPEDAAKRAAGRDMFFEATRYVDLYDRILAATRAATDGSHVQAGRVVASGFEEADIAERVAKYNWRPLGAMPRRLVGRFEGGLARVYRFEGQKLLIGIKAGGDIPEFMRASKRGTVQTVTLIVNGAAALDVAFVYNGLSGWQFIDVTLPEDLAAEPLVGCEVERDGLLLFSGLPVERGGIHAADRVNPVRFYADGTLEGWASAALAGPGADVLLRLHLDGEPILLPTDAPWMRKEGLRRFRAALPIEARSLHKISAQLLDGTEGLRSPVWVCHDETCGFLLANPRRAGDDVLLTVVPEAEKRFALDRLVAIQSGESFPLSQADGASHRYYEGRNSALVPARLFAEMPTLSVAGGRLGEAPRHLGTLPPLAPLLAP
ncbi:MAG: hypothetical protein AAFP13_07755 [Pseudomonadota bacterium]